MTSMTSTEAMTSMTSTPVSISEAIRRVFKEDKPSLADASKVILEYVSFLKTLPVRTLYSTGGPLDVPFTPDGTYMLCQLCISILERFDDGISTVPIPVELDEYMSHASRNAWHNRVFENDY